MQIPMVVITPDSQPTSRHKGSIHQESGTTIYFHSDGEELLDTQDIPLVIAYNDVHHFVLAKIISQEAPKVWHCKNLPFIQKHHLVSFLLY